MAISTLLLLLFTAFNTLVTARSVVYVQTFHVNGDQNTPLSILPLLNENTGVTHVILAMTHLNNNPGEIHLNDNNYDDPMFAQAWNEVKTLQAAGIKVQACLGGAGDGSWGHLETNFDAYYGPLRDLLKKYQLDGIDLDIETKYGIANALHLIQTLRSDFGSGFLITMAPVASSLDTRTDTDFSGFSYWDLDTEAVALDGSKLISWLNVQFYSGFGSPASTASYDGIISAGWDPARIVMGVLDSSNDGSGYVATSSVVSTIQQLKAKYPTFGGVDGWEYFDAGNSDGTGSDPWKWVQTIGRALSGAAQKVVEATTKSGFEVQKFPPSPFSKESLLNLTAAGASHFEAIRVLNRTDGDLPEAIKLYNAYKLEE